MSITSNRKLLDEVRDFMRLHHYSIHTERTYCSWIKKFVQFHEMKSREDLSEGEKKIEVFLTYLAIQGNVSLSTQNQAPNNDISVVHHPFFAGSLIQSERHP